jgi:orotidine-5'-phosphate decarboxylase
MTFLEQLDSCVSKNNSLLCVGLDPDMAKLPPHLQDEPAPYFIFNKAIIDATADLVCAYKPNSAFYEARGAAGIEELNLTCTYIRENYPHIPIILDFKRGDIGNTNNYYAEFAFEYLDVDAVTVQPYQGRQAVQSFLDYKDKGIMVLCRTSNAGSDEFQDLLVDGRKLYLKVAENVRDNWNANGNCQVVVGATYPKELAEIRAVIGDNMVILSPGMGAQGGEAEAAVKAGLNSRGRGLIINSSRETLYASSGPAFAEAARAKAIELQEKINNSRGENPA